MMKYLNDRMMIYLLSKYNYIERANTDEKNITLYNYTSPQFTEDAGDILNTCRAFYNVIGVNVDVDVEQLDNHIGEVLTITLYETEGI